MTRRQPFEQCRHKAATTIAVCASSYVAYRTHNLRSMPSSCMFSDLIAPFARPNG